MQNVGKNKIVILVHHNTKRNVTLKITVLSQEIRNVLVKVRVQAVIFPKLKAYLLVTRK